jgi:hypothetical protein
MQERKPRCLGDLPRICDQGLQGSNKSVAHARERFDVTRLFRVVAEDCAYLVDREIDPVLEIHEGRVAPQMALNLFPGDNLSRMTREKRQNSKRLRL